jgi:hypothetical protein
MIDRGLESKLSSQSLPDLCKLFIYFTPHYFSRQVSLQIPTPDAEDKSQTGPISVLEVSDPKICILAHLMSPLEPIDPLLESPLSQPLLKQRVVASELLNEIQQNNNAVGGMLLANMEKSAGK